MFQILSRPEGTSWSGSDLLGRRAVMLATGRASDGFDRLTNHLANIFTT